MKSKTRRAWWRPAFILLIALIGLAVAWAGCTTIQDAATVPAMVPKPTLAPHPQEPPAPTVTNEPAATATPLPVGPYEGALAPDFSLTDMEGNTIRLSDLRGQRVLLNFWATWCPPCRAEMPDLQSAYVKYKESGFAVLAVDFRETKEQVKKFQQAYGITFPIVIDDTGAVALTYGVRGIPSSFFISRDGMVVLRYPGQLSLEAIERILAVIP